MADIDANPADLTFKLSIGLTYQASLTFTVCYDAKHHAFYPRRVYFSDVSANKQLFFP